MTKQPRLLIVEDSKTDTLLVLRELQRQGYEPVWERVQSADALNAALDKQTWDIIICYYVLSEFSGLAAIKILQDKHLDIPCIIISGKIDDEAAVAAMRAGAQDYIMKDNLKRLGQVVERELNENENRRNRKKAEDALRESEIFNDGILLNSPNPILVTNLDTSIRYVNPAFERLTGFKNAEIRGCQAPYPWWPAEDIPQFQIENVIGRTRQTNTLERCYRKKTGEEFWVVTTIDRVVDAGEIKYYLANWVDITERKQADERLNQSEEKYRTLVNNIKSGIFRSTPGTRGRFLEVNPAMEEITGYARPELLKMDISDLYVTPEERAAFSEETVRTPGKIRRELQFKKKNGEEITVSVTNSAVRDDSGKVVYFDGVLEDITEHVRLEQMILQERDKVKNLIDIAEVMILTLDNARKVTLINSKGCEILGRHADEIVGKDWSEFLPERLREPVKARFRKLIGGNLTLVDYHENPVVTKRGDERIIAWHNTVIQDGQGRVVGTLSSGEDVTEQKEAEKALMKSEQRLKEAQSLGRIGSWEYNFNNQQIFWSDEMYELYERDKSLGPPTYTELLDIYPAEEADKWQNITRTVAETGKEVHNELSAKLPSGKTLWSDNIIRPFKDDTGNDVGLFGIAQDITERKREEARILEVETLKQLDKAKSELLSNVSHELRTPLASIKGFIETLLETDVKWTKRQQLDFLQSANIETDRLTLLIRDLLDMSRIDSGKMVLDKHHYKISEILDSAYVILSEIASKHELKIKLNPGLKPVDADKIRITQVITNLLENATKFSPDTSVILIEAKVIGSDLVVSVTDRGMGIAPEAIGHLFNRFYQAQQVVSGKTKGSGLGLAISKGIIEGHGGKIWVESKVGEGSKFSFSLPISTQ